MKKIILLLSITLFTCSNNDDTNSLPNSAYKLVNILQLDSNNNIIQDLDYTYDEHFRLIEATDDNNTIYYNYTNGKLTSFSNSAFNTPIKNIAYNGDLVSSIYDSFFRFEYIYNNLNQITSTKGYDIETNDFLSETIHTFDNENNMVTNTNQINGSVTTHTYDTMKNITSAIYSDTNFLMALYIGNNNILQTTLSNDPSYLKTREYEYNNENFPTIQSIYINGVLDKKIFYTYAELHN